MASGASVFWGLVAAALLSAEWGAAVNLSSAGRLLVSLRRGVVPTGLRQRERAAEGLGVSAPTGAESELWANGTDYFEGLAMLPAEPDSSESSPPSVNARKGIPGLVEGDIIVDTTPLVADAKQDVLMGAICTRCRRWPEDEKQKGTYKVPYTLTNGFSAYELSVIHWVFGFYAHFTNVRFIKRTAQKHYIAFRKGTGCNSHLGFLKKEGQNLTLEADCFGHQTVAHELLHALGIGHEHQRKDRGQHVVMHMENICDGSMKSAVAVDSLDTKFTEYDIASAMHYQGTTMTCKRGTRSMTPKDPTYDKLIDLLKVILSSCDLNQLYMIYPGPKNPPPCQANVLPRACKPSAACIAEEGQTFCEHECRYRCGFALHTPSSRWKCDLLSFEEIEKDYYVKQSKPSTRTHGGVLHGNGLPEAGEPEKDAGDTDGAADTGDTDGAADDTADTDGADTDSVDGNGSGAGGAKQPAPAMEGLRKKARSEPSQSAAVGRRPPVLLAALASSIAAALAARLMG